MIRGVCCSCGKDIPLEWTDCVGCYVKMVATAYQAGDITMAKALASFQSRSFAQMGIAPPLSLEDMEIGVPFLVTGRLGNYVGMRSTEATYFLVEEEYYAQADFFNLNAFRNTWVWPTSLKITDWFVLENPDLNQNKSVVTTAASCSCLSLLNGHLNGCPYPGDSRD